MRANGGNGAGALRVLCVDDDPDFQHLIGMVLGQHGFDVHYAFSGQEGYEKILELKPDVVLLDMMLPVMDGAQVIAKVKEHKECRDIPIIVMTAFSEQAAFLERTVRRLGAVEYLRKPVRMEELLRILKGFGGLKGRNRDGELPRKGAVRLDPQLRTVWINDRLVATLPPKRFELLAILAESPGEVRRDELMRRLWDGGAEDNALEKAVERLRRDLGPEEGERIRTTESGYELDG